MDDDRDACRRANGWLGAVGLRPTRQRMVLARLLVGDARDRHVSAEELFAAAREAGAPVSLATVYNTLKTFCDSGLMQEITVDGSKSYFDTRTDDHPHFYWEDTGELTDAPSHQVTLSCIPEPPPGTAITKVDVLIRLRRT